ncbi:endonuclease III [Colwellia psychrerythraea]|uniref:Endonuclease III n=1 Tax=Colwellia psychrerythraea TaxID=28229 RepID=A0A1Y5E405_COLPS|nr:endonuclease III [Colwellia psychrerythraea]
MNKEKRLEMLTRLRDENPEPTTELNFSSPFELLIAVLLSAQATDVGVNKATDKLYPVANTPQAILDLGLDGLKSYIKTIGLFNTKAQNTIKTCQMLVDLHGGEVPENRAALEALPGVGRKTANVVLNTSFGWLKDNEGKYFLAVDTHIYRLANRTKYAPGKTVDQVEANIIKLTPRKTEFMFNLHHWFILHGRYTCTAKRPKCGSCIIEDLCEYKDKASD